MDQTLDLIQAYGLDLVLARVFQQAWLLMLPGVQTQMVLMTSLGRWCGSIEVEDYNLS